MPQSNIAGLACSRHMTAVGWPLATPRYNHFKRFVELNPELLVLDAIVFPHRMVESIQEVPVIDYEQLVERLSLSSCQEFILTTINASIAKEVSDILRPAGIAMQQPHDLLRSMFTRADNVNITSPFPHISVEAVRAIVELDERGVTERVLGLDALVTCRLIKTAFSTFQWDLFFDLKDLHSVDEWAARALRHCIASGVRDFVFEDYASPYLDVLLQVAALLEIHDCRVHLRRPECAERLTFLNDVLGDRLHCGGTYPSLPSCIVAGSVERMELGLDAIGSLAAKSFGLAHAKRSLADLEDVRAWLELHGYRHRFYVEQCSVDPSSLYVMIVPI